MDGSVKIGAYRFPDRKKPCLCVEKGNTCTVYGSFIDTDLVIRICPNAQAKMEADFLHEMIHGMLDHLGYTEHDEKKVDELANVLHMVIPDNPAVFVPVREGQHENG